MRIFGLALSVVLIFPALSLLGEDDKKTKENKEASVSSIAENLQPDVRNQIAELLSQELERVKKSIESEEKKLEELRSQIKKQESKLAQSKLTAKFLQERLDQWRPSEDTE